MADTPAGIPALELDALWDEFHRHVNMTSQELSAWLRTCSAGEGGESPPGTAGAETGRHVLAILQKRRTDLTDDDVRVMYEVVDAVTEQRRADPASPDGDTPGRYRLMTLGHDPLKPV